MKKVWGVVGVVGAGMLLLIGMGIGKLMGRTGAELLFDGTTDESLSTAITLTNQQLPRMVDEATRLDRVSSGSGRVLTYHYTLVGYYEPNPDPSGLINPYKATDPLRIYDDLEGFKARIAQGACESPSTRAFLSKKLTVVYQYRDVHARKLFDVTITPEGCGL
ncbi:hypothetical protein [Lysobacter sp. CA196]|uniref:hypothetical protein n=1 Tax=Lysobacter sp. CA196 TaxID=3455606 RepID=UPI003F8D4383